MGTSESKSPRGKMPPRLTGPASFHARNNKRALDVLSDADADNVAASEDDAFILADAANEDASPPPPPRPQKAKKTKRPAAHKGRGGKNQRGRVNSRSSSSSSSSGGRGGSSSIVTLPSVVTCLMDPTLPRPWEGSGPGADRRGRGNRINFFARSGRIRRLVAQRDVQRRKWRQRMVRGILVQTALKPLDVRNIVASFVGDYTYQERSEMWQMYPNEVNVAGIEVTPVTFWARLFRAMYPNEVDCLRSTSSIGEFKGSGISKGSGFRGFG